MIKKFIMKAVDLVLYLPLAAAFMIFVILTASFGKKARPRKKTGKRGIVRFCSTNLDAILKWNADSFLQSNLEGFFSKSFIICMPNTISENGIIEKGGVTIIQLSQHPATMLKRLGLRRTNSVIAEIASLIRLLKLIIKEEISIILAQDPHFTGVNAMILSRLTGVPYMIHVITNYDIKDRMVRKLAFPPFMFKSVEEGVERYIFGNAYFVTASYENYKEYALKYGAPKERTFALKTFVNDIHFSDPGARKNPRPELEINPKTRMLLYVSRLAAVKFPLDVLRAFDLVEKKFYDSVLVIVGDGPLKASIRQLSEDLGISGKIIFINSKSQAELSELYASSDCIVFPHAGITLVEAALSAKPIVAYDYEWHPEVIGRDERGYLVPFRDYRAMAEKIEYVFNHYGEALGKASSARLFAIKEFNKDAIISLERSVFEKFLG